MTLASRYKERLLRRAIREVLGGFGDKSAGKGGNGENVRGGGQNAGRSTMRTAHSNGNILDDEDADLAALKQDEQTRSAACCLVLSKDGKILAVSRKDDPTMWGMPGGKVDPGEDAEAAAARELQEETGLTATSLSQVYTAVDAQGYRTTTFACGVEGEIDTDESGLIRWVDPSVLVDPNTSPYVDYNRELLSRLDLLE